MADVSDFSIQGACDLVGIDAAKQTFAEFWPVNESSDQVLRLARKKDSTCLYIRLSPEEGA